MAFLRPFRWGNRLGRSLIGAAVFAMLCAVAAMAQNAGDDHEAFSEYEIKAAFLVNFAKYVEWPESAFSDPESPFKIGVLGPNPFGDTLAQLLGDQKLDGRKMAFEQSDDAKDLLACQIVFVPGTAQERMPADLEAFKAVPVLTVGEQEDFAKKLGVVNFVIVDTKVKFEINLKMAKEIDLKVSPRLLKLAVRRYE